VCQSVQTAPRLPAAAQLASPQLLGSGTHSLGERSRGSPRPAIDGGSCEKAAGSQDPADGPLRGRWSCGGKRLRSSAACALPLETICVPKTRWPTSPTIRDEKVDRN